MASSTKLSVEKALKKLRQADTLKSGAARLDEDRARLEDDIKRMKAQTRRLKSLQRGARKPG